MTTTTNGSTSLAVRPARTETALAPADAVRSMSWAEMMAMGDALVRTGFLPDAIKTGAQAAAIIMAGAEMGIPPMRAFRTLYIYKGKIDEYADSQLARFKAKGGRSEFRELTATKAVLWLQHPNGDQHVETFTVDDARAAGLTDSNANYKKNPKSMLRARAITNGLKSVGFEDAVGNYDPMEIDTFTREPVAHPESVRVVETKTTVVSPDLAAVKKAAWAELERLKVGAGMSPVEMKNARMTAAKRALDDDDRYPETLNDWETVLLVLKEEPTPITHVEREPGSDDDIETAQREGEG